jgi:deoxycytidine triphosphate deaminase
MFILPQRMIDEKMVFGIDAPIEADQIQQIGLDLRVAKVQRIAGTSMLMKKQKQLPGYIDIDLNQDNCWYLLPNQGYVFESMEQCVIPPGFEGKVIHRSSLNRSAVIVTGSIYDPGYKGIIAGTIYVHQVPLILEKGARIAQFEMSTAEMGSTYNGDFQNQKSHTAAAEKVNDQNRR